MQSEILKRLQEAGVGIPGPLADRKLGTVDITIERPAGHPDLLVAITKLGVPCSLDNSLYIFGQDKEGWNLVLSLEAKDIPKRYKSLRKKKYLPLQGDITYAISPPDKAGNWFLVAASVAEWCKYDWRGIEYEVVRPGPAPDSPRILLDQVYGFWFPGGGPLLAVSRDRFRLVFDDSFWNYDGPAPIVVAQVHRWSVVGDQVVRIQPVALYPKSFVDYWVTWGWDRVAQRNLAQSFPQDRGWHSRLDEYHQKSGGYVPIVGLDFVQPCPGSEKKWVIGSPTNRENRPEDMPKEIFFTVFQIEGEFYMGEVGPTRPPGCPGEARPQDEAILPKSIEP